MSINSAIVVSTSPGEAGVKLLRHDAVPIARVADGHVEQIPPRRAVTHEEPSRGQLANRGEANPVSPPWRLARLGFIAR